MILQKAMHLLTVVLAWLLLVKKVLPNSHLEGPQTKHRNCMHI